MRNWDDECMHCSKRRPEVELVARMMDGEVLIDRVTLCRDCAEQNMRAVTLSWSYCHESEDSGPDSNPGFLA